MIHFDNDTTGQSIVCAVADAGVGIRTSLERIPEYARRFPYDWVAIEYATHERISGTGDSQRGIGSYGVTEDMLVEGRQLLIHSGVGMMNMTQILQRRTARAKLFPGVLIVASIPC